MKLEVGLWYKTKTGLNVRIEDFVRGVFIGCVIGCVAGNELEIELTMWDEDGNHLGGDSLHLAEENSFYNDTLKRRVALAKSNL